MFLRILSISSIRPIRPIAPLPASPFVLLPSPFLPPATPNHGQPTANFFLVVSADLGQLTAARRKGSPGFADRLLSASFEAEKIHWNTPSKEEKKKKKTECEKESTEECVQRARCRTRIGLPGVQPVYTLSPYGSTPLAASTYPNFESKNWTRSVHANGSVPCGAPFNAPHPAKSRSNKRQFAFRVPSVLRVKSWPACSSASQYWLSRSLCSIPDRNGIDPLRGQYVMVAGQGKRTGPARGTLV